VRRAQILDAALRCFAERGYRDATTDDVVRASGLSKGSLYRFFRSKDELLGALFDAYDRQIAAELRSAESGEDPLEALERTGASVLRTLIAERALMQAWAEFFAHRDLRQRFARAYRRSRQQLRRRVQSAIDAGQLRPLDAAALAAGLLATVEGLLLQAMVDPSFEPEEHWPVLWAVIARGLRP
jgi:AcrR family transcriptional regulator